MNWDYFSAARGHLAAAFAATCGMLAFVSAPAAAAIPECTPAAVAAAAPAGMTIGDVPNLSTLGPPALPIKTVNGVAYVPANARGDGAPEYCYVTGTVVTNPKSGRTANFAAALPSKQSFNGKFMFQGCGGNCGEIFPPNPAALRKGYPLWSTDDGHVAKHSPDPRLWNVADTSWAIRAPGQRDEEAMTDFYHRAVHTVSEVGRKFTLQFYRTDKLKYSYFEGCSDGGREGMVSLSRYPQDFDGIIAGAPYFDIANELVTTIVGVQAQLRSPGADISPQLFKAADRIVTARCDAADGVKDGLIQDPARCNFDPQRDLPRCGDASAGDAAQAQCFTPLQIDSLSIIFSAIKNESGSVVYPGFSVSNLHNTENDGPADLLAGWLVFHGAPNSLQDVEPWSLAPGTQPLGWYWSKQTLTNFVYDGANGFNAQRNPGITFQREKPGQSEGMHAIIPQKTVALLNQKVKDGSAATPAEAARFLQEGRKLLMYHGYSDGDITPYRTVQYYRELARQHGGADELKKNAQLYMVPGMAHCFGGPGPNSFGQNWSVPGKTDTQHDIVTALEQWVEQGRQPVQLIATKHEGDSAKKPVLRTMPLCPYPAMAKYSGRGDVNDAANWSCSSSDRRLDETGAVGNRAGVYAPISN